MPPFLTRLRDLGRTAGGLVTATQHGVEMPDGVRLATAVHRPAGPGPRPAVLIRTPYGTGGLTGTPVVGIAKALTVAGYAVVVQDVRGRFGSGSDFRPLIAEAEDGARTAEWLHDQPWCDGHVGAWGVSYLGATALAVATEAPNLVQAVAVAATHSSVGLPDPGGVRHLDTTLRWLSSLDAMVSGGPVWTRVRTLLEVRRDDDAWADRLLALPVADLDLHVLGHRSAAWQAWIDHPDADDPYWAPVDRRALLPRLGPTAHTAGWYDVFVDRQMADVEALQDHQQVDLVVGPWGHLDPRLQAASLRQARAHFDTHLRGADGASATTRVWLGGADRWWRPGAWPPPHRREEWLLGGGRMQRGAALTAAGAEWTYDPTTPTPSSGGRSLTFQAGRVDCGDLEARPDVVVHSSPPLPEPLTLVGRGELRTVLQVDTGLGDLWVRLTDVDRSGRSVSVTDGYARVRDAAAGAPVVVRLHPIAHRFAEGHRMRVLVAGGAFPAVDRNLGDGLASVHAQTARPSRMRLERGASLVLPILA